MTVEQYDLPETAPGNPPRNVRYVLMKLSAINVSTDSVHLNSLYFTAFYLFRKEKE
jgi:hypothetical protein